MPSSLTSQAGGHPAGGSDPAARPAQLDPALCGAETILLVDDEASVRRTAERYFGRYGYGLVLADDGVEAIVRLEQDHARIALVVTDMVMPRMDARDLVYVIRHRWPGLPVLLSTGYDMGRLSSDDLELFDRFVPKPYTPDEMLRAIRQTLDRRVDS